MIVEVDNSDVTRAIDLYAILSDGQHHKVLYHDFLSAKRKTAIVHIDSDALAKMGFVSSADLLATPPLGRGEMLGRSFFDTSLGGPCHETDPFSGQVKQPLVLIEYSLGMSIGDTVNTLRAYLDDKKPPYDLNVIFIHSAGGDVQQSDNAPQKILSDGYANITTAEYSCPAKVNRSAQKGKTAPALLPSAIVIDCNMAVRWHADAQTAARIGQQMSLAQITEQALIFAETLAETMPPSACWPTK